MILDVKPLPVPLTLSEMAYVSIKKSIMNMDGAELSADVRFEERRIAQDLGISRTPLREAVKRLVTEGFLRVEPRKGLFVIKKSRTDLVEILLVRSSLEGLAARLAAGLATKNDVQRMRKIFSPFDKVTTKDLSRIFSQYSEANIAFHELVIQLSRCRKLVELAAGLFDHVRWIRSWSIYNSSCERRFPQIHKDHLSIINAMSKRDPEMAEKRMRAHIEKLILYLSRGLDQRNLAGPDQVRERARAGETAKRLWTPEGR
jgi:DNA-binding GntR family transcriptional regulator